MIQNNESDENQPNPVKNHYKNIQTPLKEKNVATSHRPNCNLNKTLQVLTHYVLIYNNSHDYTREEDKNIFTLMSCK